MIFETECPNPPFRTDAAILGTIDLAHYAPSSSMAHVFGYFQRGLGDPPLFLAVRDARRMPAWVSAIEESRRNILTPSALLSL